MIAIDIVCFLAIAAFLILNQREIPADQREGILKPFIGIGLFFIIASGLFYVGIWLLWPK